MKILLTALLAAVLVTAPAAARTSGAAGRSLELCGPSVCASTNAGAAVAEFEAFVGPITDATAALGFPPAVRPYYSVKGPGLKRTALYLPAAGQVGLKFKGELPSWFPLGTHANAALRGIAKRLRPFPAPRPAAVLVNARKVRHPAIYAHIYDNFPQPRTVAPSTRPWISVQVKWPIGTPWPEMAFNLRRGTRVMLRSDHAVLISKALAKQILADVRRATP